MPITFDLTAEQGVPRNGAGPVLGFAELTSAVRRPRELARILWAERRDEVVVCEDDVPKSAKQAAAGLLAGLANTQQRRLVLEARPPRRISGPAMLARGSGELVRSASRELRDTVILRQRAERDCRRARRLPRRIAQASAARVLYLRAQPRLAWKGQAVGGAVTHMTGVINGMTDGGVAVEVLAPGRLPGLRAPVREVPMRRIFHFESWLTMAAYAEELEAAAAAVDVDLVYQRCVPGSLVGLRVASRLGVPLVLEYNGSELWVERNWSASGRPSRGFKLQERIERACLTQASLIVVVSEPLRDQLLERGIERERILVNPNGVDTDALGPFREGTPADWRRRTGLPEAPTIGFIGTFGLWHGVLELPAMIAVVAQTNPDARWVLIGDGQHRAAVEAGLRERGLAERVTTTGALARDRALQMLAGCDLCVSPHVPNPDGSRFFGSPTKLFEYMGLAKAIVASDLEQIGEVLGDGETALLHEPGDSAGAARAVARMLDDPGLRDRLGRAAYERAEADYTWRAHAARILSAVAGAA